MIISGEIILISFLINSLSSFAYFSIILLFDAGPPFYFILFPSKNQVFFCRGNS